MWTECIRCMVHSAMCTCRVHRSYIKEHYILVLTVFTNFGCLCTRTSKKLAETVLMQLSDGQPATLSFHTPAVKLSHSHYCLQHQKLRQTTRNSYLVVHETTTYFFLIQKLVLSTWASCYTPVMWCIMWFTRCGAARCINNNWFPAIWST